MRKLRRILPSMNGVTRPVLLNTQSPYNRSRLPRYFTRLGYSLVLASRTREAGRGSQSTTVANDTQRFILFRDFYL